MTVVEFKHGAALSNAVREVVGSGIDRIAVAYWGPDACRILDLPADMKGCQIICDARSGFCSPEALRELLSRGATVLDVPMLHSKVYLSETKMVVGSANASARGLTELDVGLEAGCLVMDREEIASARKWFDGVADKGAEIIETDLPEIAAAWNHNRNARILRTTLYDAILNEPEGLKDRKLRVYLYSEDTPTAEHIERYRTSSPKVSEDWDRTGVYPFFWGEFPSDVEIGEELLCFAIENGVASEHGVWNILAKVGEGERAVWPSAPVERPFGKKLGSAKEIEKRISQAISRIEPRPIGEILSLTDFAKELAKV